MEETIIEGAEEVVVEAPVFEGEVNPEAVPESGEESTEEVAE